LIICPVKDMGKDKLYQRGKVAKPQGDLKMPLKGRSILA